MSRYLVGRSGRSLSAGLAALAVLIAARVAFADPHYFSFQPQYAAVGAQIVGGGINNSNTVAFQTTIGGVTTVYTSYLGSLTKIADSNQDTTTNYYLDGGSQRVGAARYTDLRSPGIDDDGNAYFVASVRPLDYRVNEQVWPLDRVVTGSGASLSPVFNFLLSDPRPYAPVAVYSDSGIVAATSGGYTKVISNGVTTPISGSPFIGGPYFPVVNNSGMAAGSMDANGLYISNGSAWTLGVPGAVESNVAINNHGSILFERFDNSTHQDAVLMLKDGVVSTVIGSSSPFPYFISFLLNDSDAIAFAAYRDLVKGIFVGGNPATDKVIAVGDNLDGSTITDLSLFKKGLNNSGDIAFVATLADGRSGVYIAHSIPEPSTLVLLAVGVGSLLAAGHRNRILRTRGSCPAVIEP